MRFLKTLAVLTVVLFSAAANAQRSEKSFSHPNLSSPLREKFDLEVLKSEALQPLPKIDATKWDGIFFDQKTQQKLKMKGLNPKGMGQGAWGSGDGLARANGSIQFYDLAEGNSFAETCKTPTTFVPQSSALVDLGFDRFTKRESFAPYQNAQEILRTWSAAQPLANPLLMALKRSLRKTDFFWVNALSLPASTRLPVLKGFTRSLTLVSFIEPIGVVASRPLWNRLDGCSQTALFLHEAFRQMKAVEKSEYSEEQLREIVRVLMTGRPQALPKNYLSVSMKAANAFSGTVKIMVSELEAIVDFVPFKITSATVEADTQLLINKVRSRDTMLLEELTEDPNKLWAVTEGLSLATAAYCENRARDERKTRATKCEESIRILAVLNRLVESTAITRSFESLSRVFTGLGRTVVAMPLVDLLATYVDSLNGQLDKQEQRDVQKIVRAFQRAASTHDGTALFAAYTVLILSQNSEK